MTTPSCCNRVRIFVSPSQHGGVVLTGTSVCGEQFKTVVNGDQLEEMMFLQNTLHLPPDLVLHATPTHVKISRRNNLVFTCSRAGFVDVVRGISQQIQMEAFL